MNTIHRSERCIHAGGCGVSRTQSNAFGHQMDDLLPENPRADAVADSKSALYRSGWCSLARKNQQSSREEQMTNMSVLHRKHRQGGYVMISAMALTLVLLGIGMAFMQWASDESAQSQHNIGGMQAYYLAQTGVIEQGLRWLRVQQAGLLPQSEIRLNPAEVIVDREVIGSYDQVKVAPVLGGLEGSNIFFAKRKYRISAVGKVVLPWYEDGRKVDKEVYRKAILYVSVRSFADYMYLTDHEVTPLGETVRFFHGDTLNGRVHSNDTINIMQDPVFYGLVTTSAERFGQGANYNPRFLGPEPGFGVPKVDIPIVAQNIRDGAAAQGNIGFDHIGQEYRLSMRGSMGIMYNWEEGAPFDSTSAHQVTINSGGYTCIFVDAPLSMHGQIVGDWTIGCSHDIYLIDNVYYSCLAANDSVPPTCDDYCGIVSEKRVLIANTWANGRENSAQGSDIVICAAIVALGEEQGSFSFDQQNDTWDTYIGPNPDNRGQIHLRGSVTQRFRGYVHRSNQSSTGYLKDYDYDFRFLVHRPPCFLDAVDQSGRALFDVVQWGQAVESQEDIRRDYRVRYN